MPGRYTEPASRAKANNDPKCNPGLIQKDASGSPTPSYAYQVSCPNDQNLIYVQGREIVGSPPPTPLSNRQGIPKQELGKCVRCNLQIEGSGPKPTDVIMDGGTKYSGNPDKNPSAKPRGWAKHVVLRVDRGDGFVGRNFTDPRRTRVRLLHRGDRRHPAGEDQVLLGRRLRPPELHHRPPRDPRLRRVRGR